MERALYPPSAADGQRWEQGTDEQGRKTWALCPSIAAQAATDPGPRSQARGTHAQGVHASGGPQPGAKSAEKKRERSLRRKLAREERLQGQTPAEQTEPPARQDLHAEAADGESELTDSLEIVETVAKDGEPDVTFAVFLKKPNADAEAERRRAEDAPNAHARKARLAVSFAADGVAPGTALGLPCQAEAQTYQRAVSQRAGIDPDPPQSIAAQMGRDEFDTGKPKRGRGPQRNGDLRDMPASEPERGPASKPELLQLLDLFKGGLPRSAS